MAKPINHINKTAFRKKGETKRVWFILDASEKTLGRLASEVTKILRGKHRPDFTPFIDTGDGVIIINAEKIKVTGNKAAQKMYRHHTGYIGNLREIPFRTMQQRKPTYILEHAIRGMMPKTRIARAQERRLRIFAGEAHNMDSQNPITVHI